MIDFVGIGVARSGTTWTARHLMQHEEVFMPFKEANIFQHENYRARAKNLFNGNGRMGDTAGEWSPAYFIKPRAAENLKKYNPKVKLLVNLRNPVDRAWSWFTYCITKEKLPSDTNILDLFYTKKTLHLPGKYDEHLKMWFDHFPKENFHFTVFDDMMNKPVMAINKICGFLNVKKKYKQENLLKIAEKPSSKMTNQVRRELKAYYKKHVEATRRLLKINLPW